MLNPDAGDNPAFTVNTGVNMDASIRKSCPIPSEIRENILKMKLDEDKLFWPEISHSMPRPTDVC